jgi:hypothetical protein
MWPGPSNFNPFPIQQYGMQSPGRGRYIQPRRNDNQTTSRFSQARARYGNKRGGKKQQQNGRERQMVVEKEQGNKQLEEHAPGPNQDEPDT